MAVNDSDRTIWTWFLSVLGGQSCDEPVALGTNAGENDPFLVDVIFDQVHLRIQAGLDTFDNADVHANSIALMGSIQSESIGGRRLDEIGDPEYAVDEALFAVLGK